MGGSGWASNVDVGSSATPFFALFFALLFPRMIVNYFGVAFIGMIDDILYITRSVYFYAVYDMLFLYSS